MQGALDPIVNKSVRIQCNAEGLPFPKITWLKDGAVIFPNSSRHSYSGGGKYLDIQTIQATDTGWYECYAENIAGHARKEVQLSVSGNLSFFNINNFLFFYHNIFSVPKSCQFLAIPRDNHIICK